MHDWIKAFKTALWLSPIVFIAFMLIINIIANPIIIVFLLVVIFLIAATTMLIKLFWYIEDKYFKVGD